MIIMSAGKKQTNKRIAGIRIIKYDTTFLDITKTARLKGQSRTASMMSSPTQGQHSPKY